MSNYNPINRLKLSTSAPGGSENVTLKLRKGCSYRITMHWLKSKQPSPLWYCWEAKVGGLPTAATFNDYSNIRKTGVAETLVGNGWFADNTGGLLTSHVHMKSGGGGNVAGSLSATLHVLKIGIVPDYDRNGIIDDKDGKLAAAKEVFRFWINDDKDSGGVADGDSDLPGQSPSNKDDNVVNGPCDLLDFFPIWLDLKTVLDVYPPGEGVEYLIGGEGLKFVYTKLTKGEAGSFLTKACTVCGPSFSQNACEAPTFCPASPSRISAYKLSDDFLNAIRSDGEKGVLMVEVTSDLARLELEVLVDGDPVVSARMPLIVNPVEEMFDRLSLRNDGSSVTPGGAVPPDTAERGHVVFAHGFNVTLEASRAAGAEMFKRLWQSASKAKFHSVTWNGDIGWPDWMDGAHYHEDVDSAFRTAPRLAVYVNGLSGTRVVMAHSLGNMVVSSAIADHGMNVGKYFMFNAAIPAEAFDASKWKTTPVDNEMVPCAWFDYPSNTWCSTWHRLFTSPDNRAELKWESRLTEILSKTVLYNYFSSGDEVLELFTEAPNNLTGVGIVLQTIERYSWHKQEAHKGTGAIEPGGTTWAGWGFGNPSYTVWETDPSTGLSLPYVHPYYPDAAAAALALTDQLRDIPVFRKAPSGMFLTPINSQLRGEILARGVPALSGPTGSREIMPDELENIDMNAFERPNDWPRLESDEPYKQRWKHGDWKVVAFFYNFKVFEDVTTKGGLK